MSAFLAILFKDLQCEFRTGTQLLPFITVSLLLVTFLGLGVASFVPDDQQLQFLFHPLVWSVFLLSGSMTLVRVFESDREASTLRALFLFRVSPISYFFAKVVFIALLLICNQCVTVLLLAALLDVPIFSWMLSFLLLTGVVALTYASLGAFIGGFISQHRQRHVLFPLVLLPLLFPVFFAVLQVSTSIAAGDGVLGAGSWFSLLVGLLTVYLLVGIILFDIVVRE